MKFIFLNFCLPISNIQYYTSIIPASHKDMLTQKTECTVTEKKKILPGDFKYILKHHLIMTGCHFIADLFFNKFIFFCCSHSKNFGAFSSSQLVLSLKFSLGYPKSFLLQELHLLLKSYFQFLSQHDFCFSKVFFVLSE